jgi:hypothetical protein
VLLERRAREGILDGSVTVLVRRWRRPQATAGGVYRTAAGRIAVDEVTVVDPATLTDDDARPAGYATAEALTPADVAELDHRLDRLDHASSIGPWTMSILRAIQAEPGRRAGDLAAAAGRERLPYKTDVRKLKTFGLTISLPVGYRLSPRGEAYLRATTRR